MTDKEIALQLTLAIAPQRTIDAVLNNNKMVNELNQSIVKELADAYTKLFEAVQNCENLPNKTFPKD